MIKNAIYDSINLSDPPGFVDANIEDPKCSDEL